MPQVTSAALRLPAGGGVAGTVVITAAALPGAARAQFTVSAVMTGGAPRTVYDLIGSDCSTADPRPDSSGRGDQAQDCAQGSQTYGVVRARRQNPRRARIGWLSGEASTYR